MHDIKFLKNDEENFLRSYKPKIALKNKVY